MPFCETTLFLLDGNELPTPHDGRISTLRPPPPQKWPGSFPLSPAVYALMSCAAGRTGNIVCFAKMTCCYFYLALSRYDTSQNVKGQAFFTSLPPPKLSGIARARKCEGKKLTFFLPVLKISICRNIRAEQDK